MEYAVAVAGGGAAGLAAAVAAARALPGAEGKIIVLEKNPRVGKKLLMTGNGRCNLTNRAAGERGFHGDAALAAEVLRRFPPERVLARWEEWGLLCREEGGGRFYPQSGQASSVLDVLRFQLGRFGVEERCGAAVRGWRRERGGFRLETAQGPLFARRVILAAGGRAAPKTGSDGSGAALARQAGHCIVPEFPTLVQVRTDPEAVKLLKGARCAADISLFHGERLLRRETGEIQFADGCVSGVCAFQLSRMVSEWASTGRAAGEAAPGGLTLAADLLPAHTEEDIFVWLARRAREFPSLPGAELFTGALHKRAGQEIARRGGFSQRPLGNLRREELRAAAARAKRLEFPARGVFSWEHAQATAGGVPLEETDPRTLGSIKQPGLFFAGEVLNIDGDCGGFNLHWAWASGWTAGEACAASLRKGRGAC